MSKLLVKLIDASSVLTPGQNQVTIFMDSSDSLLKGKFDDGSVVPLGSSTSLNVLTTVVPTIVPENAAAQDGNTIQVIINRLQGQIDNISISPVDVLGVVLTTFSASNTVIQSGDTILEALQNTQGQINAINSEMGDIAIEITDLQTTDGNLQTQITNITNNFPTNVLATTLGTVTPSNLAIATGNTISVAFDRTQGQINAINANFTLGTITPANTALASGISIATAWNRVQGQINAINTSIAGTINRIPYYDSASSFGDSNLAVSGTDVSFVADGRIHRTSGGNSASLYFSVGVLTSVITDGTNSCTTQATTSAYSVTMAGASGQASRFSTSVSGSFLLATPITDAKITLSTTTVEIRRASAEGDGLLSFNFITGETNNAFEIGNDDCLNAHLKIIDGDWFGIATLASGEVNISNASCTGDRRIFVTPQDNSTKGALRVIKSTGSFIIRSSDNADNGEVAWWMIDAKPK